LTRGHPPIFPLVSFANQNHRRRTICWLRELASKRRTSAIAQGDRVCLRSYFAAAQDCDEDGIDAVAGSTRVSNRDVVKDKSLDFYSDASVAGLYPMWDDDGKYVVVFCLEERRLRSRLGFPQPEYSRR
jgi:hypothetical protein